MLLWVGRGAEEKCKGKCRRSTLAEQCGMSMQADAVQVLLLMCCLRKYSSCGGSALVWPCVISRGAGEEAPAAEVTPVGSVVAG